MDRIREIITYIQGIEISNIIDFIIALAFIIIVLIISPIITSTLFRFFYKKEEKQETKKLTLYKTIRTFINILGIYVSTKILKLTTDQNLFIDKCFRIVLIWTIANIIAGILELNLIIIDKMENKNKIDISQNDKFLVKMISKIVKYILYILATYITLKEFGYDLGGIATGIGIGGAIIALAAQNLVKQLLAGFAILSDKPFEIGDSVEIVQGANKTSGKVAGITWRSTKLKTAEDTIVTIDNSVVIDSNVVNWGKINKRTYSTNLHLALETDEQIVEKVINRIKFILKNDSDVITKSIRVHLTGIDGDYLNILVHVDTSIIDYGKYTNFCNKLNLTILNILETQGVSLAYPGRNIYIKERETNQEELTLNGHLESKSVQPVRISKNSIKDQPKA